MKDAAPQPVRLSEYTPFPFVVEQVDLRFTLAGAETRVHSKVRFAPNPAAEPAGEIFLHGKELELISARIDGAEVSPVVTTRGLTCPVPSGAFTWEAEVRIDPTTNTSLDGLYTSGGMYCTQCEAEGFRKITFYPDRPDVMAPFRVQIDSDMPVRLSNGNMVEEGVWDDPWPKPAYLFALVAGDLRNFPGEFKTMSGKDVELNIWVRPGDEARAEYAMDALKRSMAWDEEVYGREYDLQIFNIVAVDDFNMGAMENKGLNIFNSKYVLASPETATDTDYDFIEGIIAHEYFHNWTGNRITCRDWFQLCLKEGLTVFRDQQFSSDMRGAAVKRITEVMQLRARQFREDQGPLAHPVRPEEYIEINNFYTATVYEKGAEVIHMLKALVGDEGYAKALDLYFERHDGDAATIEDWLKVFEDATGRDLSQFSRWYSQAGTPRLTVEEHFKDGTLTLDFKQETKPTPGQPQKQPQVIPIAVGLIGPNGNEVAETRVLEMNKSEQSFEFTGLSAKPVSSILRNFSAPVVLDRKLDSASRAFLLAHDTDPFNRWEAGRVLGKEVLTQMITEGTAPAPDLLTGLSRVVADESLEPAYRALMLGLPSEDDLAQTLFDSGHVPDPAAIHAARDALQDAMAAEMEPILASLYEQMETPAPYSPDAEAAGKRSLRGACLGLLSRRDGCARAKALFEAADNMTEELAALAVLIRHGQGEAAVQAFYDKWRHDRLVMDKWFMLQVVQSSPETMAETVKSLTEHADFDWKNPNRFRSVLGGMQANPAGFHRADGAAYRLYADWLLKLDPVNPQTTARMTTAFETWARYDADRQQMMREQLERIAALPGLSENTGEMVGRILG
ncbi:aminopeptidase N [Oceanicola sp. 502str15]|uniref:aminopeptidase N n=1 Tax=Oceanicola sp. 502str15 TaxID=2696061 RepID=UPI002096293F|nr:aminopeptidase N [Oceanicola sp. 502str15]MCO6382541.1 aminopeptidase N [Oceanicola sp. 502str15]